MRITTKGQVTIPLELREKHGFLPGTEVDFESDGKTVTLIKARNKKKSGRPTRGSELVAFLTGRGSGKMTTDEIMKLTRGWGEEDDLDRQ